jgi:hypothetical protein
MGSVDGSERTARRRTGHPGSALRRIAKSRYPGSEIRRLFTWLRQKELTTVITAERDQPNKLTRYGIEEFVSDCVILLD